MIKYSDISKKQVTDTGVVFALVSIISGLYYNISWYYYLAAALLLTVLVLPSLIKPLAFLWWNFSVALSWVMSRAMLTTLFILLITPVGLFRRAIGKDTLQLKAFKKNSASAFIQKNQKFTQADLKYPF